MHVCVCVCEEGEYVCVCMCVCVCVCGRKRNRQRLRVSSRDCSLYIYLNACIFLYNRTKYCGQYISLSNKYKARE